MITFPLGDKRYGRLGNQMFEAASTIGLADKHNTDAVFPKWAYSKYFKHSLPEDKKGSYRAIQITEPYFHYAPAILDGYEVTNGMFEIHGWLQSEKYFKHCESKIRKQFEFNEDFRARCLVKYIDAYNKPTIAISIRIGADYVQNGNYFILPISYYITALFEHFPDWRNYNLLIFSDDIEYCKVHFGCLENAYFIQGSDIEQLCLMSCADNFIIANSTFSWWGAWLSNKPDKKVVRSPHYFAGKLFRECNIKDFYPAEWTVYDHLNEEGEERKIDLSDTVFTIPVSYDHPDRLANFELSVAHLQKYFDTNIHTGEHDGDRFCNVQTDYWTRFPAGAFHRTKMLNCMASISDSSVVVNYDCDVLIPPIQIFEAVEKIRSGKADMVYPYDGRFARVPRANYNALLQSLDCGIFRNAQFKGMGKDDFPSVGGAVVVNKEKFFESGGENENFISYGAEDLERKVRWEKLGYKVERIKGVLYHIDHHVGVNSSSQNPHFNANEKEYRKVNKMTKEELLAYVKTWPWLSRIGQSELPATPSTVDGKV